MEGRFRLISKYPEVTIARWSDRVIAWIIDFAIISVGIGLVYWVAYSSMHLALVNSSYQNENPLHILTSVVFFVYWIVLESKNGQSLGKKVMNLQTTNMVGQKPGLRSIVISSFGKSFFLPLDLILGWIFAKKKKQRLFNRFSDTIVIKLDSSKEKKNKIRYRFD